MINTTENQLKLLSDLVEERGRIIKDLRQEISVLRKDVDQEMDRLSSMSTKLDEFINNVNEMNRTLRNFSDGLYAQGFDC